MFCSVFTSVVAFSTLSLSLPSIFFIYFHILLCSVMFIFLNVSTSLPIFLCSLISLLYHFLFLPFSLFLCAPFSLVFCFIYISTCFFLVLSLPLLIFSHFPHLSLSVPPIFLFLSVPLPSYNSLVFCFYSYFFRFLSGSLSSSFLIFPCSSLLSLSLPSISHFYFLLPLYSSVFNDSHLFLVFSLPLFFCSFIPLLYPVLFLLFP